MQFFKDLKVGTKLLSAFCLASCITLVVGVIGIVGIIKVGNSLEEVAGVRTPSLIGLGIMNEAQTAVLAAERSSILEKNQQRMELQQGRLAKA